MSFGLQVFDSNGIKTLDTSYYNGLSTLKDGGFVHEPTQFDVTGLATRNVLVTGSCGFSTVNGYHVWNTPPVVKPNGSYAYAPTPTLTGGPEYFPIQSSISYASYYFITGKESSNTSGFGADISGVDGNTILNTQNVRYYVIPDENGNFIRNGVAYPATSYAGSSPITAYDINCAVNYFQNFLMYPPLIFVTESSGPISFLGYSTISGFITDGFKVCAAASIQTISNRGTGYYGGNQYTFKYFIALPSFVAYPFFKPQSHGFAVYNSDGASVFDTSLPILNIDVVTANNPYMYASGSSLNHTGGWSISKLPTTGVCINSLRAASGVVQSHNISLYPSPFVAGCTSTTGIYANVSQNSVNIAAGGTNGMFTAGPLYSHLTTYDFLRGISTTADFLFGSYG